jgi:hypothetical protein
VRDRLATVLIMGLFAGSCGGRTSLAQDFGQGEPGGDHSIDAQADGAQLHREGGCGGTCSSDAGVDGASSCTVAQRCVVALADSQFLPNSLAIDQTSVYWTNAGRGAYGSVAKVNIGGGAVTTIAPLRDAPASVAVDLESIYWVESVRALMSTPLSGGALTTLATSSVKNIALDAHVIYWPTGGVVDGAIESVPKVGGLPTTLLSGLSSPTNIAVDSGTLYWNEDYGALLRMPTASGLPVTVVSGQENLSSLFVGAARATWAAASTDGNGSSVVTDLLSGSGAPITLASGQPSSDGALAITADTVNVYWTTFGTGLSDGTIMSIPLGGGPPVTLASAQDGPTAIAVDATSVYWTTASTVMKVTPK